MANVGNQLPTQAVSKPAPKHGNVLPLWGNEKTMNLNPMILTNVLSSPYFKVQLYELKTYHEVVDEIYFKVTLAIAKPHASLDNDCLVELALNYSPQITVVIGMGIYMT